MNMNIQMAGILLLSGCEEKASECFFQYVIEESPVQQQAEE